MSRFAYLAVVVCWLTSGPSDAVEPDTDADVQAVVARALPYLQREGADWINQRGCVSCHQVPLMLWSLSAAEQQGYDVDRQQLRDFQDWSTRVMNFVKPAQKSKVDVDQTLASNIDTINALLQAIPNGGAGGQPGWRALFAEALAENQKPDGSWQACGQLPMQKRPAGESTQVTVLWTLLVLAQQQVETHDSTLALQVAANENPTSTEWWVARLLLADQIGEDAVLSLRADLWELQRDDGGWGWLTGDESDALATGMALYALRKTAPSVDDHADHLDAATRFLASTQQPGGWWNVPGTKRSTRERNTPTSNYWGTAWAVVGLLQ